MNSSLSKFSLTLFSHLKRKVFAVFLLVLFLFIQSVSLFAQTRSAIACPADIVQSNDSGKCSAIVKFPDVTNSDPNLTVVYSKPSGVAFPVGTTTVVVQLFDQNGYSVSSCNFNVTVVDKEAPVISNCPGNLTVNNTKDACGAIVSFTKPTVFERCTFQQKTFNYTGVPLTFVVPAGVTSVNADIKGAAGGRTYYNHSAFSYPGLGGETQTTIPVTPGQVLIVNVGGAGQDGSATSAGSGGFNGGGNGSASLDQNNLIEFAGGGGGGASDIRTGTGFLADRIAVAGGGGAAGFTYAGGHGGDLAGQDGTGASNPATGGTQTQGGTGGSYDGDFYAQNGFAGTGGSGAANVPGGGGGGGFFGGGGGSFGSGAGGSSYAFSDATNVYHIQGAQEGNGSVTFSYNQPAILVQTAGLPSGSTFPVGETINTFTATDAAGNTSTCTFKVTVTDNEKPLITAPSNITLSSDNNSCAATNVTLGTPVTSDNCGVAGVTNNAPSSFTVGTTTVTYTATDIHGNTATATQTVTVTDDQKPVLTVPADQTFTTTTNSYTVPALGASDNCGVSSVTYSISGATTRTGTGTDASGSFNPGTSVITFTVTDIHGNIQTGTTTVNVTATAPAITVTIPDVYAVSPGGKWNTIYIGYGPSVLTLMAVVSTGKSPYTYEWTSTGNNNVISRSQTLAVYLAGEYVVTVKDATGATGTFKKQIQVVDIRCNKKDDKEREKG